MHLLTNLLSCKIKSIEAQNNKCLIISNQGDILEVKFTNEELKFTIKRISKIIKLNTSINSLKLSDEVEPKLFLGGSSQTLISINTSNKEVLDINKIGQIVTCIDCYITSNYTFIICLGTKDGLVYFRKNWGSITNKINVFNEKYLTLVKFGLNADMLIVGSVDHCLFILINNNINYSIAKTFYFDKSYPICTIFNSDYTLLLITTNKNKNICVLLKDFSIITNIEYIEQTLWIPYSTRFYMRVSCPSIADDISNSLIADELLNYDRPEALNYDNLKVKANQQNEITIKKHENAVLHKHSQNNKFIFSDIPVICGNKNLMLVASDFECNLRLWKNLDNLRTNIGFVSNIHSDHIKEILINDKDDMVFSCGENEKMIVQWKISEVLNDKLSINNDYNNKLQQFSSINIKSHNLINMLRFNQFDYKLASCKYKDSKALVKGFVSHFLNKLFSKKLSLFERKKQYLPSNANTIIEYVYSSQAVDKIDSVLYLHSYNQERKGLISNTTSNYGSSKYNKYGKKSYKTNKNNKIKDIGLSTNNINQYSKYNSKGRKLSSSDNNNNHNKVNLNMNNIINPDVNYSNLNDKELLVLLKQHNTKNSLLEYMMIKKAKENYSYKPENSYHSNCQKKIIYYNGRFIIIKDLIKKTQRVFQQHLNKITSLAIHPTQSLIASADVNLGKITLLIWDYKEFETKTEIKTKHNDGVIQLAFSPKGTFLISLAVNSANSFLFSPDNNESKNINALNYEAILQHDLKHSNSGSSNQLFQSFSIQIHQPEYDISLEPRNISNYPVFGVKFFPNNEFLFVTYGYRVITIWEINYSYITIIKQIDYQHYTYEETSKKYFFFNFLCVDFMFDLRNNLIKSDLLFGSSEGDIFGIINNDFTLLKKKAHDSEINCLRITEIRDDVVLNNNKNNFVDTGKENYDLNENNEIRSLVLIITAGEDSFIKIWDKNFELLKVWSPFSIENISFENDFRRVRINLLLTILIITYYLLLLISLIKEYIVLMLVFAVKTALVF